MGNFPLTTQTVDCLPVAGGNENEDTIENRHDMFDPLKSVARGTLTPPSFLPPFVESSSNSDNEWRLTTT